MRERRTTRRRWLPAALVLAVGVGALAAPTGGATAAPAAPATPTPNPGPDDIEIVDLPTDLRPSGLNDRGQVLGLLPNDDVVVVEDGAVADTVGRWDPFPNPLCSTPICFLPSAARTDINNRGVVGTSIARRATLWDDGELTDLNGDALGSWFVDLNDRGQALIIRLTADRQTVGVWERGRFSPVGSWPLDVRVIGRLSERGHVALQVLVVGPNLHVGGLHWYRGVATELPAFAPTGVNRRGQVAGVQFASPTLLYRPKPGIWDDGEVTLLPTLDIELNGTRDIDDHGRVVGYSVRPGTSESATVLWDDGELIDIGATLAGTDQPQGLSDRGQVLFSAFEVGAVWEDGETRILPGVGVTPYLINDRNQVLGARRASDDPAAPTIPTLWEL